MRSLTFAVLLLTIGCEGSFTGPGGTSPLGPRPNNPGPAPGPVCDESGALTGESQRLAPNELQNALEAAFGFRPDISGFPAPDTLYGFSTEPGANVITVRGAEQIAEAADSVGLEALDHLASILPCAPNALDQACAHAFIADAAPQLFRGAEDGADVARLQGLYDTLVIGENALGPELAIAGVISAMIQSPGFLYLIEAGENTAPALRTLTEQEIANRLAFLFLDGPPDPPLLAAVDASDLRDADVRRAQALRLLEEPAARQAVVGFFREWFWVSRVDLSVRVRSELAAAWEEEFSRVVEALIFDQEDGVSGLVSGAQTFVNRTLAEHYGLPSPPPDDDTWVEVTLPPELQAGILSRGAVANAINAEGGTSIIRRGHFVREMLLCDELQLPPPGATEMDPMLPPDATVRERSDARRAVNPCGSCHGLMDPIGIGMEDIDELGRFRTEYDNGQPIDSAGEIAGLADGAFDGTAELGALLAANETLGDCTNHQWFRYAMGRTGTESETSACLANEPAPSGDLLELLLSIVTSESFILRADPEEN
ncbi:MAG: DUF1588 domain-containing protein [Myxococcota bacterium]